MSEACVPSHFVDERSVKGERGGCNFNTEGRSVLPAVKIYSGDSAG